MNNEVISPDNYAFDPIEVVGDDLNVLEYQIPYDAQKRIGGFALAEAQKNKGD